MTTLYNLHILEKVGNPSERALKGNAVKGGREAAGGAAARLSKGRETSRTAPAPRPEIKKLSPGFGEPNERTNLLPR